MQPDILQVIREAWLNDTPVDTHSIVCYKWHYRCAIAALIAEVEALRDDLNDLARERDSWQSKAMGS